MTVATRKPNKSPRRVTRKPTVPPNLVDQLFGALGHGTWEEYDLDLDWKRFSEGNLRRNNIRDRNREYMPHR